MKYLITAILSFLFLLPAFGQVNIALKYNQAAQGSFITSFNHTIDGAGASVELTIDVKAIPNLQLGASLATVPFNTSIETMGVGIFNISTGGELSNNLYRYQVLARYFFLEKDMRFRPFFQIQGGGITYSTLVSPEEGVVNSFDDLENINGTTWLMGLSSGFNYRIFKRFSFQFNLGYNFSGRTKISLPNEVDNRRLNHLFLELGLVYTF